MGAFSIGLIEPISKMSFGLPPLSAGLVPRFKSSTYRADGESSNAGKFGPAARVPAKPLGEDGILNQNPIFEMDSRN
jgi:hypothetical protein